MKVETAIVECVNEAGLALNSAEALMKTFTPLFVSAAKLVEECGAINVTDATQVTEIRLARVKRLEIKAVRVEIDKCHKAAKEDALRRLPNGSRGAVSNSLPSAGLHCEANQGTFNKDCEMSQANTQVQRIPVHGEVIEKSIEYIPFRAKDAIKLSVALVQKYLCKPTRQGFNCSDAQAMKFIMLCKARYLNPWEGDAYIVGYDTKDGPEFNLITAHQALLKRAEANTDYDGMESGVLVRDNESGMIQNLEGDFIPDDCVLVGGWAKVHSKGKRFPSTDRLNLSAFKKAYGRWNDDPAGMIVKCAEASALRKAYPNTLGGMFNEAEGMASGDGVVITPHTETPAKTTSVARQITATRKAVKAEPLSSGPAEGRSHAPSPDTREVQETMDEGTTSAPEGEQGVTPAAPPEATEAPEIIHRSDVPEWTCVCGHVCQNGEGRCCLCRKGRPQVLPTPTPAPTATRGSGRPQAGKAAIPVEYPKEVRDQAIGYVEQFNHDLPSIVNWIVQQQVAQPAAIVPIVKRIANVNSARDIGNAAVAEQVAEEIKCYLIANAPKK